jgi:deoxyribodipyrimidine photo-lyase
MVIQTERIKNLNQKPVQQGDYILYWMQNAQRAEYNHALEYATQQANHLKKSLLVAFGIMDNFPEANLRHYWFMLEGLQDVEKQLKKRNIKFVLRYGLPSQVAIELSKKACLVVTDRGYLRMVKSWREEVAQKISCSLIQIETDVVVPANVASGHAEFAARTIRPKITRQLQHYLVPLRESKLHHSSLGLEVNGLDLQDIARLTSNLKLNHEVKPVNQFFQGGNSKAQKVLDKFIVQRFKAYAENRNQPQTDDTSYMGMYLHYGQISPLYIARQILEQGRGQENIESYIEELIVRRELAMNFVNFNPDYDRYEGLPAWAKKTLQEHAKDKREFLYSLEQLELAQTHDPYWNASMNEMRYSGYMHNYMRMYWGKKILEWSKTPQEAFAKALYLNNKYFLDGRDANSFTGVAWCFGTHDRPWAERAIFGKVRYMNAAGLERKADPKAYVEKVERLRRLIAIQPSEQ